jgi:hypothetical protein
MSTVRGAYRQVGASVWASWIEGYDCDEALSRALRSVIFPARMHMPTMPALSDILLLKTMASS